MNLVSLECPSCRSHIELERPDQPVAVRCRRCQVEFEVEMDEAPRPSPLPHPVQRIVIPKVVPEVRPAVHRCPACAENFYHEVPPGVTKCRCINCGVIFPLTGTNDSRVQPSLALPKTEPIIPSDAAPRPAWHGLFSFQGRINRAQYISCSVIRYAALITAWVASVFLMDLIGLWVLTWMLAVWMAVSASVRRLRDAGEPAWAIACLTAIPIVSMVVTLFCVCVKGQNKRNKYGEVPDPTLPWG